MKNQNQKVIEAIEGVKNVLTKETLCIALQGHTIQDVAFNGNDLILSLNGGQVMISAMNNSFGKATLECVVSVQKGKGQ